MWMGTYPTLPSYVLSTREPLRDVLNANKEKLIGKTALDKFGADLPFLPKVLPNTSSLWDNHVLTVHLLHPLHGQSSSSPNPSRQRYCCTLTPENPREILGTQTTNPRSEWRSQPLSFLLASNRPTTSRPYFGFHLCTSSCQVPRRISTIKL